MLPGTPTPNQTKTGSNDNVRVVHSSKTDSSPLDAV